MHFHDAAREQIAEVHRRAKACKGNSVSRREPEVGIYWMYNGDIFHQNSVPVSVGIEYGTAVNGTADHYHEWRSLQKSGATQTLPAELQEEYDTISRGRVVYHKDDDRYVIFHGDSTTQEDLAKIRRSFNLPHENTVDEVDFHYNPLPEDFDFHE